MNLVAWNCRHRGRHLIVRDLTSLVRKFFPTEIFLCETKSLKDRMEVIKRNIPFDNLFVVKAENHKGGLALVWANQLNWTIISASTWIIGILVSFDPRGHWMLWCCYYPIKRTIRKDFWKELKIKVSAA